MSWLIFNRYGILYIRSTGVFVNFFVIDRHESWRKIVAAHDSYIKTLKLNACFCEECYVLHRAMNILNIACSENASVVVHCIFFQSLCRCRQHQPMRSYILGVTKYSSYQTHEVLSRGWRKLGELWRLTTHQTMIDYLRP